MNVKLPDDQTLWFRNLPPKASDEGSEKVRPAKKFTGTNQLASREERVTNKSLPTRWSHYIRYKQRRCSNSRLLLRC